MRKTFIEWLRFISKKEVKWDCYEIHVVQARMYGCGKQCEECRLEQLNIKNRL